MAMTYFAADRVNLLKEITSMKLDLSQDFVLSLGTAERGVKYDKAKYEKIKGALCNAALEIPLVGALAWKYLHNQVCKLEEIQLRNLRCVLLAQVHNKFQILM